RGARRRRLRHHGDGRHRLAAERRIRALEGQGRPRERGPPGPRDRRGGSRSGRRGATRRDAARSRRRQARVPLRRRLAREHRRRGRKPGGDHGPLVLGPGAVGAPPRGREGAARAACVPRRARRRDRTHEAGDARGRALSLIRDPSLAAEGERKIRWVAEWMPVLNRVRDRLRADGTVTGRRLAVILPVEPKTAYLAAVLAEAGAEVSVAFQGVMVHDDVAAGLAGRGVEVFAQAGSTREQELTFFEEVLARRPEVVIDDRADVIRLAHTTHPEVLESLIGASEETTSGVVQLRAMEADGTLKVPCIAANDARCKYLFDNRYGTGQSSVNAVLDRTNLLAADKDAVVVGYGWVGKGIAA